MLIITLLHMTFRRKRKGSHVKQRDGTCIMTQIKLDMKKKMLVKKNIMDGIKNRLYTTEERLMSFKKHKYRNY